MRLVLVLAVVLLSIHVQSFQQSYSTNEFRPRLELKASLGSLYDNPYSKMERERDDTLSGGVILPTYDGEEIQQYYSQHLFEVWERLVDIGSPLVGWWIVRQWDKFTAPLHSQEVRDEKKNQRAIDLKDAIIQGKSITFMKSGQALSLRPDLVKSPEYIRELAALQDEVGTFPTPLAMDIIQQEFERNAVSIGSVSKGGGKGASPMEVYEFDPPDPVASASIGQVFRAR